MGAKRNRFAQIHLIVGFEEAHQMYPSTSLSLRIIMLLAEPWNLTKTKDLYRLQAPSYVFDQKDKGHLQKE